jgi:DNA-entry nuclease
VDAKGGQSDDAILAELVQLTDAVPRGTIVDVLSSDGAANQEFVVINDAEGWSIDYTNSTSTAR